MHLSWEDLPMSEITLSIADQSLIALKLSLEQLGEELPWCKVLVPTVRSACLL